MLKSAGQQQAVILKNAWDRRGTLSPLKPEGEMYIQQAGFPTPKQELQLLETDFLLVLSLWAQIGI